jgi:pimeloyl-ACP methyl ester carboxylesterase
MLSALRSKPARICVAVIVALVCAWLASTGYVTWSLTHRERAPYAEPLPAWSDGRVREVRIATRDGEELGGWWSGEHGRPIAVLLLHGNGSSRAEHSELMRWLVDQKCAVLALTFRAHGDSTGTSNDVGWRARSDVVAGVEFIERNAPGVPIVVIGRSLGAVASIYAAGELGSRVSGYVLESPYRDLETAVRRRLRMHLSPPFDEVAFAGMRLWSHAWLPVDLDQCRPIDHVLDIPSDVPVVFFGGSSDRHAPAGGRRRDRRASGRARGDRVVRRRGAHEPLRVRCDAL